MSRIEWTGSTWNPVVGCSVVSPGCTNCYAMKMAARLDRMGVPQYVGLTRPSKAGAVWTGETRLVGNALTLPLRTSKPTTWFVNSMSDLFHESIPDAWIDRVFAVMALCPQHTFQILTKRSARMRAYMIGCENPPHDLPLRKPWLTQWHRRDHVAVAMREVATAFPDRLGKVKRLPLPNVWLGVSCEDQTRADERVPDLLATPAAVRFVSAEPLLGPIDFEEAWHGKNALNSECWGECAWCEKGYPPLHNCMHRESDWTTGGRSGLDWIIVGGESGPGARPMHPAWARAIRDQCRDAGVAFFFKQWGAWLDESLATAQHCAPGPEMFGADGMPKGPRWHFYDGEDVLGGAAVRIGKRAAGRLLDGVTHDAMPEAHHV